MSKARVIVVGNEKGGCGKSTVAVLLTLGALEAGHRVGVLDLDVRQKSLSRFFENRRAFMKRENIKLSLPQEGRLAPGPFGGEGEDDEARLADTLETLSGTCDVVVIDTPGSDTPLSRAVHGLADVVLTPLNDSLVDLDVLALIEGETDTILGPSHYAESVWARRKEKMLRDGAPFDWVVLRNRLTNIDSRNKRRMQGLLSDLEGRLGFRSVDGFAERVIFREFFSDGLSITDLRILSEKGKTNFSRSHLVARQELRTILSRALGK